MSHGSIKPLKDVEPLARLLEALADERRLRIVALLSHGELCVCHFEGALAMSQPDVSRQLGILRHAGVVVTRRERNWVYYRLADQSEPLCRQQIELLVKSFFKRAEFQRDIQRLVKSRGPDACK